MISTFTFRHFSGYFIRWVLDSLTYLTPILILVQWLSGKKICLHCRSHGRCEFDPWVGKILWRRKWQPAPVFLPGEKGAWQATVYRVAKSQTGLKQLSMQY